MPEIFISYAHRDNEFPRYEPRGWIDCFYDALHIRLDGIRGRRTPTSVWLDRSEARITGTSVLTDTIRGELEETSVLLAIVSPAYEASTWCADELRFFTEACERSGGIFVGRRTRVVKVFKLPTTLESSDLGHGDHADVTGYTFYSRGRDGRPLEFDPPYGNDLGREFSRAINTLAYDLADLLDAIAAGPARGAARSGPSATPSAPAHASSGFHPIVRPAPTAAPLAHPAAVAASSGITVYLAETSYDVRAQRESVRGELQQYGHTVVPEGDLPHGPEYADVVREAMRDARLSIHIAGASYGVIPERSRDSIVEIQYRIAGEIAQSRPEFVRLPWLAPGGEPEERQSAFIASLQDDAALLGGSLEDLKTRVRAELSKRPPSVEPLPSGEIQNVYLIFDPPDRDATQPLDDWLFAQGFEVLKPIASGTPTELRTVHRNNLKMSDGVLIYYGNATEAWLRTKLNDLETVYALGRRKRPLRARGVVLADPKTPDKEAFRRHTVRVVPGFGGFRSDLLSAFVEDLRARSDAP